MQYIEHDQGEVDAYYMRRGMRCHAMLATSVLNVAHGDRFSEAVLVDHALRLLRDKHAHWDDWEWLSLCTNWESLLWQALEAKDEHAIMVCLEYTDEVPRGCGAVHGLLQRYLRRKAAS